MFNNSLTILLLVSCILISGCVFTPSVNNLSTNVSINQFTLNESVSGNVTPIIPPIPGDFPVYISEKYINNGSGTIVMYYSEIVAHDYTNIPVSPRFPGGKLAPFCGYSGNLSKISEIAMNDNRTQKILKDGGIIEDVNVYAAQQMLTHNENPCDGLYLALYINIYISQTKVIVVNESAMNVVDIETL